VNIFCPPVQFLILSLCLRLSVDPRFSCSFCQEDDDRHPSSPVLHVCSCKICPFRRVFFHPPPPMTEFRMTPTQLLHFPPCVLICPPRYSSSSSRPCMFLTTSFPPAFGRIFVVKCMLEQGSLHRCFSPCFSFHSFCPSIFFRPHLFLGVGIKTFSTETPPPSRVEWSLPSPNPLATFLFLQASSSLFF